MRLQEMLDEGEVGADSFDIQAVEHYLALASGLQELGRFDEAAIALEGALQLVRINGGLYTLDQLLVLERLTDNAWQGQDWSAVESHFYLTMNIVENNPEISPSQFEELTRKFTHWKIQTFRNGLDVNDDPFASQDGIAFYQKLLDGLSIDEPDYIAKKIQYVTELSLARYYAAMSISELPFDEFESIGPETVPTESCYTVTENTSNGPRSVRVCESKQAPNPLFFESRQKAKFDMLEEHISWIRRNFSDLIEELEDREDVDPVQLAQVVLTLGDMNFLLNDNLRARTQYERAFEILQSNDIAEDVQLQLMGQPQEILESVLANMGLPKIESHAEPTGLVSFDVTQSGTIRNIGITGSGADLEEANQQLVNSLLQRSVYRPKIEGGEPVESRLEVPAAQL